MTETNELIERLRREAQQHAQEARTQRSIVQEILQIVSGATGETGDWYAAKVVREKFDELREKLREAERELSVYKNSKWNVFCAICDRIWAVDGHHPGRSICPDCERKYRAITEGEKK